MPAPKPVQGVRTFDAVPVMPVPYNPEPPRGVRSYIDISLTKDEVIDAMVETERTILEERLEVLQKEAAEAQKVHAEFCKKESEKIQKTLAKQLAPLVRAMTNLTGEVHSVAWGNWHMNVQFNSVNANIRRGKSPSNSSHPYYTHYFSHEEVDKLVPAEAIKEYNRKDLARREKIQQVQFEISNLSKKGRRARSALVIELLKGSDDGRKMLGAAMANERRRETRRAKKALN